jgi:hypothetical protein
MGSRYDTWSTDEDDELREPLRPLFSSEDLLWFILIVLIGLMLLGVYEIHNLNVQVHELQMKVK